MCLDLLGQGGFKREKNCGLESHAWMNRIDCRILASWIMAHSLFYTCLWRFCFGLLLGERLRLYL